MSRRLIINADGYGFTPGVNEGVVETFGAGMVRSTSCTPNFGFLGEAKEVSDRFPHVSFGIHFNLSVGKPVLPPEVVPSLVGVDGQFHGNRLLREIVGKRVQYEHAVLELKAQAALLADQGIKISHFDGHQNKHLYPLFFDACLEVARHFAIRGIRTHRRKLYTETGPVSTPAALRYYATHPIRIATHWMGRRRSALARKNGLVLAERLISPGYVDASTHKSQRNFWFRMADTLPDGDSEIYCHPAFPDEVLRANAKYAEPRRFEVDILTDPELAHRFQERGIKLINFFELAAKH